MQHRCKQILDNCDALHLEILFGFTKVLQKLQVCVLQILFGFTKITPTGLKILCGFTTGCILIYESSLSCHKVPNNLFESNKISQIKVPNNLFGSN